MSMLGLKIKRVLIIIIIINIIIIHQTSLHESIANADILLICWILSEFNFLSFMLHFQNWINGKHNFHTNAIWKSIINRFNSGFRCT